MRNISSRRVEESMEYKSPSASMMLDTTTRRSESKLARKAIRPRTIRRWVGDDKVSECFECTAKFTLLNRRHHCRVCGRIFCGGCCFRTRAVPRLMLATIPRPAKAEDGKHKTRMCGGCYDQVLSIEGLGECPNLFLNLPVDLQTLYRLGLVCRKWNIAIGLVLSMFREIQYLSPSVRLSTHQRRLMSNNRHIVVGHSRWETKLYRIVPYIKGGTRKCSCTNLMCSRLCDSTFTVAECIELIEHGVDSIKDKVLDELGRKTVDQIKPFIPTLVILSQSVDERIQFRVLIPKACVSVLLAHLLYWELRLRPSRHTILFTETMMASIPSNISRSITSSITLSGILIEISKGKKERYQWKRCDAPAIPGNPNLLVLAVEGTEAIVFPSASKPVIIPVNCFDSVLSSTRRLHLMIKNDDLRTDSVVMNAMHLSNDIVQSDTILNLPVLRYSVVPFSPTVGMVELVPNAETLYAISKHTTLQNHVLSHNPQMTVDQIRTRIAESFSVACVCSFLFGFGDRHLENVMVTNAGVVFHIDYQYILGQTPMSKSTGKLLKITPGIIETMGGVDSEYYSRFGHMSSLCYNAFRRRFNEFYYCFYPLGCYQPPIQPIRTSHEILSQLEERFIPGEAYEEASLQIKERIRTESEYTTVESIVDGAHHMMRQFRGWLQ